MAFHRVLLLLSLFFPSVAVFSYFHLAQNPLATQLAYGASKGMQFSFPLLAYLLLRQPRLWSWRWAGGETKTGMISGIGMVAFLLMVYGFLQGMPFLQETKQAIEGKLVQFGASTPGRFLLLALFIAVAHSFLEEFYWRGYVFAELRSWVGRWPAHGLAAAGFTGHHVVVIYQYCPSQLAWLLVPLFSGFVFSAGLFWQWCYERNQSLAGAWLSHFWADVGILLVGAHLVFGG